MKHLVLMTILVLGSAGIGFAQTAPELAPLPDEKTLTITDTGAGAADAANPAANAAPADITVWDFVKMFVILALVIGMILGFLWFMKRLSGQGPGTDAPIKVLHTHVLGGNRTLQVVEVGNEILLIGTGDGGIHLVKDLTDTEAGDSFRLAASQGKPLAARNRFSDLLGNLMGVKPKIRPDVGEPVENSSDFLKKQRERLKKL